MFVAAGTPGRFQTALPWDSQESSHSSAPPHSAVYPALEFKGAAERSEGTIGRRMKAGESIPFFATHVFASPNG
jgi:hypothetical protein